MKKIIAIAVAVITTVSAFAQKEAGSFSVTPKVGVNFATVMDDNNSKMKADVTVGAEVDYLFTTKFALSAGVLYSGQGAKIESDYGNYKGHLNYLNVPILANFYVAQGFALKAGVQPGFLLSAKSEGIDIKSNINSVDLSIPVGLSYEIYKIVVDARYNVGVTKINKKGDRYQRNSVIQITLGYRF